MNAEQSQALLLKNQGKTRKEIASIMGLSSRQVKSRLASARKWEKLDPAIKRSMGAIGTEMVPSVVWDKSDPNYSVLLRPAAETNAVSVLDQIAEAFNNVVPAKPVIAPKRTVDKMLSVYPLFDVHFGMLAWDEETGAENYDTKLAESDLNMALSKVMIDTPDSDNALLIIGGDFFHADDNRAETPASRHKLDVDGRHARTLDLGVNLLATVIDTLLRKHKSVTVRVLRGNHDEHSHIVLTVAMSQRYRNEPRITVDTDKRDLLTVRWGDCLIAAHHGDKSKPERLALQIADSCAFWTETYFRYVFTGHIHNHKALDMGAIQWESLRAFCPPDSYAAGKHYASRRQLQSITFHKTDGLFRRSYDPVRR